MRVDSNATKAHININDNCFDIIRLACTFTVFFGHFLTHFAIDNELLHGIAYFVRGVPVFFFLSGLFIARSLERYKTSEFLKRRAIRIFPELWVCVLLNLTIILISLGGGVQSERYYSLSGYTNDCLSILHRWMA